VPSTCSVEQVWFRGGSIVVQREPQRRRPYDLRATGPSPDTGIPSPYVVSLISYHYFQSASMRLRRHPSWPCSTVMCVPAQVFNCGMPQLNGRCWRTRCTGRYGWSVLGVTVVDVTGSGIATFFNGRVNVRPWQFLFRHL
jgi:hypothetical protein